MTRVVLTSFEPFGGHAVNSSLEVGRALARRPPPGIELDWIILPVVAGTCVERAWARIEQAEPALVLALGQAAGTAVVRIETLARNLNHFAIPDNEGNKLVNRPIVPQGPAVYATTTHSGHIVRELTRRHIPAELSGSAGAYVCNHLYYSLLHRAAETNSPHQTGFVHLPLLPGQVSKREPMQSLGLDQAVEGLRQILTACLQTIEAREQRQGV
jgi:pyroglutamyl-peptidase